MKEDLTLVLDNVFEYRYAVDLCKELNVSLEVTGQLVPKEKEGDYAEEDIRLQTKFTGNGNSLKYLLHLLTWRMESVKLLNICLTKEIEIVNETNNKTRRGTKR